MGDEHRVLDWVPRHDPRSRAYGVRQIVGATEPFPRLWTPGPVLDQGNEGACVGFGWTAELLASPRPDPYATIDGATAFAHALYRLAQQVDEWEGEQYEGTSVLAGAKVVQSERYIGEYRWAFGIEDVRDAVVTLGPVVIGIPWLSGMYSTRPSGLVDVSGYHVGGHCLVLVGYHPAMRIRGEGWFARHEVFTWLNSWGEGYGLNGRGYIRADDLAVLLSQQGEACIPTQRNLVRL